ERGRIRVDQLVQDGLGFFGARERIEIERPLNLGIAVHRRTCRYPLVDLDCKLGFLDSFVKVGEREQGHRMAGREVERKLEIDKAKVLAAAAPERCAEPIEHLSRARLR